MPICSSRASAAFCAPGAEQGAGSAGSRVTGQPDTDLAHPDPRNPNPNPNPNPSPKQDEGYVFTFVYDSATHTSDLAVLDARDLHTVALVRLPQHVPPLFHGSWVEEVFM